MANPQWFGCDAEPANGSGTSTAGYSYAFDETCPDAGYITKIEVYVATIGALDVAVFSKSGSVFTDDHAVLGLTVATGLNEFTHANGDFDANDMPIAVGEYIGFYQASSGLIDKITSGGPGYWYDNGDQISGTPAGSTFSLSGNSTHEFQIRVYIEDTVPVGNPTVTDVETDEDYDDKDTGVTITGTAFEASQGTGKVEMGDNADYATANKVEQTVTSWADTAIDFTADLSTQSPGSKWLFVTNNTGNKNDPGFAVTVHRAQAFVMSLSSQFAPGVTTAQLTAPSGKTTGDFDAGRIEEVANPCTAINITDDDYTEIEFCFKATANTEAEQYDFRIVGVTSGALDTYTVTPQLTITSGTTIAATLGTVAVTGHNAAVTAATDIAASLGTVAVTGHNAMVTAATDIAAGLGTVAVTGHNAAVTAATDIAAGLGAVAVTGYSATVTAATDIAATLGTVAVTGHNAAVTAATDIAAGLGTVAVTGHSAAVTSTVKITASLGTVTVTGHSAAVTAATDIAAGLGTVTVTAYSATVTAATDIAAGLGTVAVTGYSATVTGSTTVSAGLGSVAVTAYSATVTAATDIAAGLGTVNVTGHSAAVTAATDIAAGLGTVAVTGHNAAVMTSTTVSAGLGSVTVTGHSAAVTAATDIAAGLGTVTVTGHSAAVTAATDIAATLGTVNVTGHNAAVTVAVIVEAETGVVIITPYDAFVTSAQAAPAVRVLTIAAQDRTLTIAAQDRVLTIAAQDRILEVAAESRILTLEADSRILTPTL